MLLAYPKKMLSALPFYPKKRVILVKESRDAFNKRRAAAADAPPPEPPSG